MRRPPPQTLAAAAVLAVLALVALLTARSDAPAYEPYASTDYRAGGYRAWATLLAHEGITTGRFVRRPIELDGRIDTLISAQPPLVGTDPSAQTGADIGALAAWVRAGGRLVYVGRNAGLTKIENSVLALPFWLPDVGARGGLTGPLAREISGLRDQGANRMLLVEHAGQAELSDGNGDIVVRYPLGRGDVVAAIDPLPFTNAHIANAGNARLAYLIGVPRRPGGVVAFDDGLHGALIDRPWYRALPLAARVALGIAALALLLGLIGNALPGIPAMRLRPTREPTSVEFIDALAALHGRTGARAATRAVLSADAFATAARSRGLAADALPELIAQRIGDGRGADDLRRLVRANATPVRTDAELLASAKLAYLARKECSYDGHGDRRRAAFAGRTWARRRR